MSAMLARLYEGTGARMIPFEPLSHVEIKEFLDFLCDQAAERVKVFFRCDYPQLVSEDLISDEIVFSIQKESKISPSATICIAEVLESTVLLKELKAPVFILSDKDYPPGDYLIFKLLRVD